MSAPTWVHVPPLSAYTHHMAGVVTDCADRHARAVRDIDTGAGLRGSAAPSMCGALQIHVHALSAYTRTWPELEPLPSLSGAPIATRMPSEDIDAEYPEVVCSLAVDNRPTWVHVRGFLVHPPRGRRRFQQRRSPRVRPRTSVPKCQAWSFVAPSMSSLQICVRRSQRTAAVARPVVALPWIP